MNKTDAICSIRITWILAFTNLCIFNESIVFVICIQVVLENQSFKNIDVVYETHVGHSSNLEKCYLTPEEHAVLACIQILKRISHICNLTSNTYDIIL